MSVAFIGLGAMGLPMAKRLMGAGFDVHGCDIAPGPLDALKSAGGQASTNPAEALRGASAVFVMTATGAQAQTVLFGAGEAASAATRGAIFILQCTQSAAMARDLGARLEALGHHVLDAPVSGGAVGAEAGALTVMASGSEAAFAAAAPLLRPLAKTVYNIGRELGLGSTVKTINQLLAGVHIAVGAEAMALGAKAGIEPKLLLDILMSGAAGSWMLGNRGPRMLEDEPAVTSAVDIFVKDLGLVDDLARGLRQPAPIAMAALQQFIAASAMGDGRQDDSQLVRLYEVTGATHVRGKGKTP